MDAKLREFLRSNGIPEDVLDKLERNEPPSRSTNTLRKSAEDDPLSKLYEKHPELAERGRAIYEKTYNETLAKLRSGASVDGNGAELSLRAINDLVAEIKATADRILKADAHRASATRGVELFNKGLMNGHDALDLPNLLKGLQR
jgi:hypothetical protein